MANYCLLLLSLAFLLAAAIDATPCHPDDLRALRGFAANLRGGGAVLLRAAWSGASCCGWEGVGCDTATGRVTTLWLPGSGLAGPILGASLADCRELKSLNLADNRLVGTIPSWIGELEHLCYLDLSGNSLVGEVPKSLIQLKGLAAPVGRSLGMAFGTTPLYVKRSRRTLQEQTNTITGSNNTVRSGTNNIVGGKDNTVVSGNSNNVMGSNNTIVTGNGNTVTGSNNSVSGSNNTVSGDNHVVTGDNQIVT